MLSLHIGWFNKMAILLSCCRQIIAMAISLNSTSFLQLKKPEVTLRVSFPSNKHVISVRRCTPMAAIRTESAGLSETLTKLKKQGKVSTYFSYWLGSMHLRAPLRVSHIKSNYTESSTYFSIWFLVAGSRFRMICFIYDFQWYELSLSI